MVTNGLKDLAVLQDALLQLDHVLMLPLDALQGPELLQSQLCVFRHVTLHPFHSYFASGFVNNCLINHPIVPSAHFPNNAVLGFCSHLSLWPSEQANQRETSEVMTISCHLQQNPRKEEDKKLRTPKPSSSPTIMSKYFQLESILEVCTSLYAAAAQGLTARTGF